VSTSAIRAAEARAWANRPLTQPKMDNGVSRNWASPTAATSSPTPIAPWAASRPPTSATIARKIPFAASTAPWYQACAPVARSVAASASRLVAT
jgi:hypothetical protein